MRYSVYAFTKSGPLIEALRKAFPNEDGSGCMLATSQYDISWSRSSRARAIQLAQRIRRKFTKRITVDILGDSGVVWRNGKKRTEQQMKNEQKRLERNFNKIRAQLR